MLSLKKYLIVKILIVAIFLVAFFLLILLSIISVIRWDIFGSTNSDGTDKPAERETQLYRYYRLNPQTSESSSGFMNIFSSEPSIFYKEAGTYELVSSFETEEYKCTGRCYCDEERRSAGSVSLVTRLIFLVGAVTSLIAYNKARDYFKEECENVQSADSCSATNVRSEVDNCEPIAKFESESYGVEELVEKEKSYECYGHCVSCDLKQFISHHIGENSVETLMSIVGESASQLRCEYLQVTQVISGESINQDFKYFLDDKNAGLIDEKKYGEVQFFDDYREGKLESELVFVETLFANTYLSPYCIEEGTVDILGQNVLACEPWEFAVTFLFNYERKLNPSIRCVDITK